jgi:ABC-type transport system substrate-binding protein
MDTLLRTAGAEMDQEKRTALFKQIVGKLLEDVPELHIGFVPRFFTFREYVKDFTTDGEGGFRPWDGGLNYTWLDK